MRMLALAALALLAACATPTAYAPATRADGPGFAEQRIETDRYRVSFRGYGDAAAVENFALRRAAEITLAQGRDWFVVDNRNSERTSTAPRTSISIGAGGYSGGRTSVGAGVGFGIPIGSGQSGEAVARLDIRLGAGPKPQGVNVYDARSVLANLAPLR